MCVCVWRYKYVPPTVHGLCPVTEVNFIHLSSRPRVCVFVYAAGACVCVCIMFVYVCSNV